MERESLLCLLIILLGGLVLQCFAAWSPEESGASASRQLERLRWLALWRPILSATLVAAALCGWALSEPDPVPDHVGPLVFIVCTPFVCLILRAVARALWSLLRPPGDYAIATVGLIWPHVVIAPRLAKSLDQGALDAALAHEHAHVRHRDPLRIWVGQFVADLQWPWVGAQRRFAAWLAALEQARDDEARARGVDGADLAAAVVGSLRFQQAMHTVQARLIGDAESLQERVARLLEPLPNTPIQQDPSLLSLAGSLALACALAVAFGAAFGERLIGPLLALTS